MRYTWLVLLLVSCALVAADGEAQPGAEPAPAATTRAPPRTPPRTLDRQAAELAWRSWLQSPESGNQNAPPRRITTKSLFITPLVCPKGQRLDRNGCVEVVTVNKDEHERILLEQLNALFTSAPSNGDVLYDYGDDEPGPLQLSIPIGLDPQAAPLHQEPPVQAQDNQLNSFKVNKKGNGVSEGASSIEAELELLKLQQAQNPLNDTAANILSHNVMNNLLAHSDKPKRDSPMVNASDIDSFNTTDEGEKEKVYGHVSVDPVIYDEENHQPSIDGHFEISNETLTDNNLTSRNKSVSSTNDNTTYIQNKTANDKTIISTTYSPNIQNGDESKLNPENDYSDIGEAIKLISRYAEVSTDDNFTKDKNKMADDSILGTRTKLQYRRNKPKPLENLKESIPAESLSGDFNNREKSSNFDFIKSNVFYRYPMSSEHPITPPPEYPFRHLQDYWPGRNQVGGVYGPIHENPRRHHHSYPHYFRPRSYPYAGYPNNYPGLQETYQRYLRRVAQHNTNPIRTHGNNQDLYSLLGLRHWFSSEDASKR